MLRKTNQVKEALNILKKALDLNPKYITSIYQLAKAYMFIGDYVNADKLLNNAQERSKERNQRLYIISSTIRIDNYIRWSKDHLFKKNYDAAINLLNMAENYANEIIEIDSNDKYIHYSTRELYYTFGLIHEAKREYDDALRYFNNSIKEIAEKKAFGNRKSIFARAFYHIAIIKDQLGVSNNQEVLDIIDKGLADCKKKTRIHDKLESLKIQIIKMDKERITGKIVYFKSDEAYGFIQSKSKEYFFHINDFLDQINPSSLINSRGKKVSFNIMKKLERGKKDMAVKIDFL